MGAWGAKLFQDDVAEDVREAYTEHLKNGKTTEEATKEIIENYQCEIDDPDDGPVFWFALADTQWRYGRLLEFVKEKALEYLLEGSDLRKWQNEGPKAALVRKKVLEDLETRLKSHMPKEKKFGKSRLYKCDWKYGDVYAYKMVGDEAKKCSLDGKYLILRKVDEGIWHPGHMVPIVRIKLADERELPKTVEEYDALNYYMVWNDNRDNVETDQRFPVEAIEGTTYRKPLNELIFNNQGMLPKYLLKLALTSKKQVMDNFVYLGNFPVVEMPVNEYIPHNRLNIMYEIFKYFENLICRFKDKNNLK